MIIKCLLCGKNRNIYPSDAKVGRGKFCSQKCYWKWMLGKPSPHPYKKGNIPWSKGKHIHLSPKTEFRKGLIPWNKGLPIDKQPNFKGGKRMSADGYILIRGFRHPYKNKGGYLMEQRLVAEKYLGRYLTHNEIIHHINGIKNDNRPENLYLFPSNKSHYYFHHLKNKPILTSNII